MSSFYCYYNYYYQAKNILQGQCQLERSNFKLNINILQLYNRCVSANVNNTNDDKDDDAQNL